MAHGPSVRRRQFDRAMVAGRRWQGLLERRARTVRLLRMGGPQAADTPERVRQFLAREETKRLAYARAGITPAFFTERRIGSTLDLDEAPPNEAARRAGIPVGRVVSLDAAGRVTEGFATGFLIARNLMLTNHHVFASADECLGCGIQFGYEKVNGVLSPGTVFALDAPRFFFADEELDFAVVGVSSTSVGSGQALESFGSLSLIPDPGKILVGQPISIIQYPEGGPKRYGVRDNELLIAPSDEEDFLQYTTDTLPGSSGSPALNKDWETVALHHSGVPEMRNGQILTIEGKPWTTGMPDSAIHWIANEGVRVSRICRRLSGAKLKPEHQPALAELLGTFKQGFASLPGAPVPSQGNALDAINADASRNLTITVQGTAHFYLGGGALPAVQQTASAPATTLASLTEKKLVFDPDYEARPGYNPKFLGVAVPLPGATAARKRDLLKKDGAVLLLKYHHFSLVMSASRKLQLWSAVNVDYTASKRRLNREGFGKDTWIPDPRLLGEQQIQDQELYDPAKKFDRGHIVRREDTAWGETEQEEIFANSDSFHFTNSTPQHQNFNRDAFGFQGLWGGLENQIQSQAKDVGNRMCIFGGPILDDRNDLVHDFGGGPMKIPRRFWKVVFVTENAGSKPQLRAYGFVLDQSAAIAQFGLEAFAPGNFKTYQTSLKSIGHDSGVTFAASLMAADVLRNSSPAPRGRPIESLSDVRV